jgi:hypothetical protein
MIFHSCSMVVVVGGERAREPVATPPAVDSTPL